MSAGYLNGYLDGGRMADIMADLRVARAYARRIEPSAWSLGALVHEALIGNQLNLL